MDKKYIRNFAIIAHIDHGKSTLADRLIQLCGGLEDREMKSQVLDSMDLEQERGITIKAQAVKLMYKASDGHIYQFNLIDTPGHVDFAYEVNRSLAACEGSILVVDASQGVQAQTLANVYHAMDNNHEILLVLNKIDLPAADPERVKKEVEDVIGIDTSNSINISAKQGIGINDVLEAVIKNLPPPKDIPGEALKALLIDSWYDKYLGIIILVRVLQGSIYKGQKVKMLSTGSVYTIENPGYFSPKKEYCDKLEAGEVGFFIANIKNVSDCKVGDTIVNFNDTVTEKLPGFKPQLSVVFCSIYPIENSEFDKLREAIEKLSLNDSSFSYEKESSSILGLGFRCGFLGLLHLEIFQERLSREFEVDIITTAPSVGYKVKLKKGNEVYIQNPVEWPDPTKIEYAQEPWVKATIIVPDEFVGNILALCEDRRGSQISMNYTSGRVIVAYLLPLNEIIFDFYDKLKSCSKGYASFDWEMNSYKNSDLVKLSILINGESADSLALVIPKMRAEGRGREICKKLKDLIPQHLFQVPIQASIGGKIIARENIKAMRKDVTAKCYGGDISRKRKLLEKQKAGKKKMRSIGRVEVPQSAFIAALRIDK